jgi:hypothetical protein
MCTAVKLYVPHNPLTVCPFGPVRVVMVPQKLADLIHEPQPRIWPDLKIDIDF